MCARRVRQYAAASIKFIHKRVKDERFRNFSDSCCDLNKEMRERFGIDYVPMRIIYGETDIPASLDWEQISFKQFYDMMRDGVRVKTAMITADEFRDVFIKYLDEGKDVM